MACAMAESCIEWRESYRGVIIARELGVSEFPLLLPLVRLGYLGWCHLIGQIIAVNRCAYMSVSCRQVVPHMGLD